MPRLIDADDPKLREKVYAPSDNAGIEDYPPMIEWADILDAPTIEAEPVRHGKWKLSSYKDYAMCTVCVFKRSIDDQIGWNYCPNCGAKMDLEG